MKLTIYTGVSNGKFAHQDRIDEIAKSLEGKPCRVIITNEKQRSSEQNRYWWGVLIKAIANWLREAGNDVTDNDVHEFIKMKYLGKREVIINGKPFERYRSTTELNTDEFSELKEKIQRDFSTKGLVIPDPDQKDFL